MNESANANGSADHETALGFVQSEEAQLDNLFYKLRWSHFGPAIIELFWTGIVRLLDDADSMPTPLREWIEEQESDFFDEWPEWLTEAVNERIEDVRTEISSAVDRAADCFVNNGLHDAISSGIENAVEEIASGVYDSVSEELNSAASGLVHDIDYDNV